MGQVLQLTIAKSAEEAFARYCALVDERKEKDLWKDLDHNKRIARAWDEWKRLFNAEEPGR